MAERLTGRPGGRGFGTGQGSGLLATVLLTATLMLPMSSAALASRMSPSAALPDAGMVQPAPAQMPAQSPATDGAGLQTALGRRQPAAVEKHIATLHRMLHVTPLQEPLW